MKTNEKLIMPRVRIAIFGNVNVGKSALTVRYLTKRFIGEYRSNTDLLYKQTIEFDSGLLDIEIIDISAEINEIDFPLEQIQWSDACMIVYSITDRSSFEFATKSLANLKSLPNSPLTYLIGNKSDLDHLRKVTEREGASLAASYGIGFCEISVAENSIGLYKSFERLLENCRKSSSSSSSSSTLPPLVINNSNNNNNQKQRKFSVSKMFGTLIGVTNNSSNNSGGGYGLGKQQQQHLIINQGTVVPFTKDDLLLCNSNNNNTNNDNSSNSNYNNNNNNNNNTSNKARVCMLMMIKRKQGFIAATTTASVI